MLAFPRDMGIIVRVSESHAFLSDLATSTHTQPQTISPEVALIASIEPDVLAKSIDHTWETFEKATESVANPKPSEYGEALIAENTLLQLEPQLDFADRVEKTKRNLYPSSKVRKAAAVACAVVGATFSGHVGESITTNDKVFSEPKPNTQAQPISRIDQSREDIELLDDAIVGTFVAFGFVVGGMLGIAGEEKLRDEVAHYRARYMVYKAK